MDDKQIKQLSDKLKQCKVVYFPEEGLARTVLSIGEHAEEGAGFPCAILTGGKYVALDNSDIADFAAVRILPMDITCERAVWRDLNIGEIMQEGDRMLSRNLMWHVWTDDDVNTRRRPVVIDEYTPPAQRRA